MTFDDGFKSNYVLAKSVLDPINIKSILSLDAGASNIRCVVFNSFGQKEWEFVNKDKKGDIGLVNWSRVIEDEIFIEQFKSLVVNKKCTN